MMAFQGSEEERTLMLGKASWKLPLCPLALVLAFGLMTAMHISMGPLLLLGLFLLFIDSLICCVVAMRGIYRSCVLHEGEHMRHSIIGLILNGVILCLFFGGLIFFGWFAIGL